MTCAPAGGAQALRAAPAQHAVGPTPAPALRAARLCLGSGVPLQNYYLWRQISTDYLRLRAREVAILRRRSWATAEGSLEERVRGGPYRGWGC